MAEQLHLGELVSRELSRRSLAGRLILRELRHAEQTEDYLRAVTSDAGVSDAEHEAAIGYLLDSHMILPWTCQVDPPHGLPGHRGRRFVPTLRRVY